MRVILYDTGILPKYTAPVPVIVVGNITVGGTGKTPICIWLVDNLVQNGWRPGIILRGYGGNSENWPVVIDKHTSPDVAGDEAILLFGLTGVPVCAGPNRLASAKQLAKEFGCNVIVSDDGLQHYALERNIEIAIVDKKRRFQNARFLPAGPLREPVSRLDSVDLVLRKTLDLKDKNDFRLKPRELVNVCDERQRMSLSSLKNRRIIAVVATGNPQNFFDTLSAQNVDFEKRVFPDHYRYEKEDLLDDKESIIVMTYKDAVKCEKIAGHNVWYLDVKVEMSQETEQSIAKILDTIS